jgi:hypothetical protein
MIWSKPSSSPADPLPEVPLAGESDGAQVSIPARRGEAVALVGLADSGKTSFLFALRHAPMRPDSLRWLWPPSSLELARMTVHPGELLPATPSGYFSTSRLHTLHRKWRRPPSTPRAWWPPFLRPARKLTIPEISGENVRDFARGVDPDTLSPQRREVHRQFGEFLDACDEVLFLAGLRDSYFEGALQQDTVEEALASAASGLRTLIGEMHASRRGGARSKIFVTFLLTKRDAVKDNPGLDWVRLPQDVSALRRLAARPGFDHAGRLFREGDDGFVEFRLNRACDEAGSDVEVQEAIAIDFIACHAPHAAAALAGLAQLPGVSLRILTGKPFGYACRTGNGESAAPMPGRLESSMVWEALDDLVERSFRWRARRGIRAAGVAAAVLLLSLSILGPGLSWWSRSMASSAIAAQRVEAAQSWLALDDWNPWSMLERAVSSRHCRANALQWKSLRDAAAPMGVDAVLEQLDKQVHARDPVGDLAGAQLTQRSVDRLIRYLQFDPDLADGGFEQQELFDVAESGSHLRLDAADGARLAGKVADLRSDATFPGLNSASAWRSVADRLRRTEQWIGPGADRNSPAIVFVGVDDASVAAIRAELIRSAAAADTRAALASVAPAVSATAQDIEKLRDLGRDAAAAHDLGSLRRIDGDVRVAVAAMWTSSARSPEPGGQGPPDVAKALEAGRLQWPVAESLRKEQAVISFDQIASEFAERLSRPNQLGVGQIEEFRRQVASAGKELTDGTSASARSALEELLNWSMHRAELLGRIGPKASLDEALAKDVQAAFGSAEMALHPAKVQLGARSGTITFDFGRLLSEQSDRACVALGGRMESILDRLVSGSTADQELALLKASVGAIAGSASPCDVPDWVAVLESARAAPALSDPAEVGPRLQRFIREDALRSGLRSLMKRIGQSAGVASVGPAALKVIAQPSALPADQRKLAAEELVLSIPSEAWTGAEATALVDGRDSLLALARDCGFDAAGFVKPMAAKALAAGDSAGFVRWAEIGCGLGAEDLPMALLEPELRKLASDYERGSGRGAAETLLREVLDRASASEAFEPLRSMLAAVDRHRALITAHQLQPVKQGGDAVRFYLGKYEVSRDEVRRFTNQSAPVVDLPPGCTACLCVDQADAVRIAVAMGEGLRLPTKNEWEYVQKASKRDEKAFKAFEKGLKDEVPADPCSREMLAREGDRNVMVDSPSSFVGLGSGVREWCADQVQPMGKSWLSLSNPGAEGSGRSDLGFRLALDPIPRELRAYTSEPTAPLRKGTPW